MNTHNLRALIILLILIISHMANSAELTLLNLQAPVSTISMSEDGKTMAFAQEKENKVIFWDVINNKEIVTRSCPTPRHILFRSNKAYVTNYDDGTITIFSKKSNWDIENQLMAGDRQTYYISAPGGENFDGKLISACGTKSERKFFLIDEQKDTATKISAGIYTSLLTFSYDGKNVILQGMFGHSPSATISFVSTNSCLSGKYFNPTNGEHESHPRIMQVRADDLWYGTTGIYAGLPPKAFGEKQTEAMLIPDLTTEVFYVVTNNKVEAFSADLKMKPLNTWNVTTNTAFNDKSIAADNRKNILSSPWAATHDKITYIFIHDSGNVLKLILQNDESPKLAANEEASKPAEAGPENFPEKVIEGKTISFHLYKEPTSGKFTLMKGPSGVTIKPDGVMEWTPTTAHVGSQQFKIKAEIDGKVSFLRISTEVLSKDIGTLVSGDKEKLNDLGTFFLTDDNYDLVPGFDDKSMILVTGKKLHILDANGLSITKTIELPSVCHHTGDREGTIILLDENNLHIFDKEKMSIVKSIKLPGTKPTDLVLHPKSKVSFVALYNDEDGNLDNITAKRIAIIDEESGETQILEKAAGRWLAIHPSGRYLYSALSALYQKGVRMDWNVGTTMPDYGNIDLVISYEIKNNCIYPLTINPQMGTNGRALHISQDGKLLSYVSGGGFRSGPTELRGYTVPAFNSEDITQPVTAYNTGAYPMDAAYHPKIDLVATCTENKISFFDRKTSKILNQKVDFGDNTLTKIKALYFSASGRYFLVDSQDQSNRRALRAFPLILADAEKIIVEKPREKIECSCTISVKAGMGGLTRTNSLEQPAMKPFSPSKIEALRATHSEAMTPAEIAKKYMKSVVVIHSDEASGTGFIVDGTGFILTCAHVIPVTGQTTVQYRTENKDGIKMVPLPARVLYLDNEQDLALLKVEYDKPMPAVQIETKNEDQTGESVTVIGHPGVGNAILDYTMTQGIISNPNRPIDGRPYIQTTAAINPGVSGGPLFNSKGCVAGLVVLKANIENAGFAVPAKLLVKYLEDCAAAKAAPGVDNISGETAASLKALMQDKFNTPEKGGVNTYIKVQSAPGAFVGEGQSYQFEKDEFEVSINPERNYVKIHSYKGNWTFEFSSPNKTKLDDIHYKNAKRYKTDISPQLHCQGQGRLNRKDIGEFVVWELKVSKGKIARLAIDFIQRSGSGNPAPLVGMIRYKSKFK